MGNFNMIKRFEAKGYLKYIKWIAKVDGPSCLKISKHLEFFPSILTLPRSIHATSLFHVEGCI
jgi:hypothetical protein